jgi:Tol biopolymer transport system component
VAYTSNRDGDAQIWIRDVDAVTQQAIEGPIPGAKGHRPRFFPDGKSLLFLRDEGSAEAAFYVNLNGGNPRSLSLVNIVEADPSPHDDGEIAWTRNSVDEQGRRFAQVGVYNTTTRQERPLFDKEADVEFASVRWSPDGRQIAAIRRSVVSATSTSIVIIDRADGRRRSLEREGVGAYGSLAWTGDSRAVVVTQSAAAQVFVPGVLGRILKIDVASNRQHVLLRQPHLFGRSARANANATVDVAGDGRLVFSSIQVRQTLRECQPIGIGGCADSAAAGRKVGTRGLSNDRQPAYSPDGRFVVFSSNRTAQLDLWVQDAQNGDLWQLTDDPDLDWDPAFTPDGKHVLWSSSRQSDHLEIWKARFDPTPGSTYALSDVTRVSSDGKDAQNPTMTKNGKWIVYASNNEAKPGIWKVPTAGGEALPLVRGQFVHLADASPSGRYAAYLVDDRVRRQNAIRVVDVETGLNTGFEIKVPYRRTESTADVTWGRARWMTNNGEWIVFVGQDEKTGEAAVYKQRFSSSGEDTWATRVPLVISLPEASTESMAAEPNGRYITVSDGYYLRSVMMAEHVPGVVGRPRRR